MDERNSRLLTIIDTYTNFWTEYHFNDGSWNQPIAEGKATIAEIIGHLLHWDKYLILNTIPAVNNGDGIVFPDFDAFNQSGYEYARMHTQDEIIQEFAGTRKMIQKMLTDSLDIMDRPTTSNGVSHCPHTGTPYSLGYIIQEFIEHDQHHKNQIDPILRGI